MKNNNLASRRRFIKTTGIVTVGFLGLSQFINPVFAGNPDVVEGYGNLLPDPNRLINLPKGFSYKIISKRGDKMDDGLLVPGKADGMGAFQGKKGRVILVRNHENNPDSFDEGAFGLKNELLKKVAPDKFYEMGKGIFPALGGTTTLIYDPVKGRVEKEYLSLAGTIRNCAGGVTPWSSWLTCEESTLKTGAYEGHLEKDHGYVFEVPASEKICLAVPAPIKGMGRFNHEAVAVDPRTGIVYLTEDRGDGLFYRYIPNVKGKMLEGGKLQALGISGAKSRDTRNWEDPKAEEFPVGIAHDVVWIDIDNVESPADDLRYQGLEKGAARFARGEGIWFGQGELYFACTNGGKIMSGQIFKYTPGPDEGSANEKKAPGKLELFAEPNDRNILKNCDNLAVAPWGDLVLCEDHPQSFIVGITPKGTYYKLAENIGFQSEMAGGVFSPSGDTFFVNLQGPGITLAINGPWRKQ